MIKLLKWKVNTSKLSTEQEVNIKKKYETR